MLLCVVSTAQKTLQELYKISAEGFKTGKYGDALIADIQALKIAEETKDCSQIAYALLQIGKMQYYNRDKKLALSFFFKSLKITDSCHVDSIKHIIYHNIGSIYTEESKTDSALLFLEKSKSILEKTNNYGALSKVNAVLAQLYIDQANNDAIAEKYITKAEEYAKLSNDKSWVCYALMKRGMLFEKQKNYVKALSTFKSALMLYNDIKLVEGRLYAMRKILNIIELTGEIENTSYISKFIDLKDSVYKAEVATKVAEYKTRYETEKKETENKFLQQKNKLNQIEIESKNKAIISLLIGVLLIIMFVFWRLSVINLKKKNRELEATQAIQKEKERISRDLHDNVGGQLSYVLYSLDAINTENKEKRTEIANNVNESVRNVISNLRETIWAINDEAISINDFSDKLKVYARTMFKNQDTKVSFIENNQSNIQLNSLIGLHLYRICQEIINNAFKHSRATELIIQISVTHHVMIEITDNGVGFELDSISKDSFGLVNMKSRAVEVGISLEMETSPGSGVKYKLVV